MMNKISESIINETVERSMFEQLMFKQSINTTRHVPFTLSPVGIQRKTFNELIEKASLFGKLLSNVSEDYHFIKSAIEPVVDGEPFFQALLTMYEEIHSLNKPVLREPLLILRTDFMDDEQDGMQIIEFNGIAAGMGPFGQKTHELHRYIQEEHSDSEYIKNEFRDKKLIENEATQGLASGISTIAYEMRDESKEERTPTFLMVIQENEDNIFDQFLLEAELRKQGVKTYRRTFKQLHHELSTSSGNRLHLENVGNIDAVYFRAGYQYSDYVANDLDSKACCESLMKTRVFIEKHRVAVSATISQHLAASKRVQMLISQMEASQLQQFGLTIEEARMVLSVVGEMRPITHKTIEQLKEEDLRQWVLKSQGEGGGHCLFDRDIIDKLNYLSEEEYSAWALMKRLFPKSRDKSTLLIREGEVVEERHLISEIGLFTIHGKRKALLKDNGYAGYLIRSKPISANEGGVHSGSGVLDSLIEINS